MRWDHKDHEVILDLQDRRVHLDLPDPVVKEENQDLLDHQDPWVLLDKLASKDRRVPKVHQHQK